MLGLPTFAISYPNEEALLVEAEDAGHLLDPRDFDVNGYPVDEKTYPKVGKEALRGKRRVDDDEDGGEADTRSAAGAGASSSSMVGDDHSLPSETGSQSSEPGFAVVSRVPAAEQRRPALAPAPSRPREKRRKVVSAGGGSQLATVSTIFVPHYF